PWWDGIVPSHAELWSKPTDKTL
ncbi:unnamed protein product, partial [Adineta ricciae]